METEYKIRRINSKGELYYSLNDTTNVLRSAEAIKTSIFVESRTVKEIFKKNGEAEGMLIAPDQVLQVNPGDYFLHWSQIDLFQKYLDKGDLERVQETDILYFMGNSDFARQSEKMPNLAQMFKEHIWMDAPKEALSF